MIFDVGLKTKLRSFYVYENIKYIAYVSHIIYDVYQIFLDSIFIEIPIILLQTFNLKVAFED